MVHRAYALYSKSSAAIRQLKMKIRQKCKPLLGPYNAPHILHLQSCNFTTTVKISLANLKKL